MFFANLFNGRFGDLLAPRPKLKDEIWSFLKAGLTDKAMKMLRFIEPGVFDINEIDVSTGTAPIHIACALGDMELVVELLSQGADVHVKASNGNNSLHYAALNERKGIIEILLRYGADRSIPNNAGLLPIEIAPSKLVKELFLRDRSSIFSPIVQSRVLLTDFIEQLNNNSPLPSSSSLLSSVVDRTPIDHKPSVHIQDNDAAASVQSISYGYNLSDDLIESEAQPLSSICSTATATTPADKDIKPQSNYINPSTSPLMYDIKPFTPPKGQLSTIEGDYTIVGVSSTRKPSTIATAATSTTPPSSANNHDSRPPHSLRVVDVPILNFDKLPPPPTTFMHANNIPSAASTSSSDIGGSSSRSGRINFYQSSVLPSPRVTIPLIGHSSVDSSTVAPSSLLSSSSSAAAAAIGPSLSMTALSGGIASIDSTTTTTATITTTTYEQQQSIIDNDDDSELRDEVILAAVETARAMHSKTDTRDLCHQMIRNCQKLNEPKFRKLLECDPTLSTVRATKLANLAVDGQTPLHVAAGFGNLLALQIMVELGQKHNMSLWIRDMQGRTPLHIAAEKGHEAVCTYLREQMRMEKQRDPVGEHAPTDLAGTTPLGWAAYESKGKPKKQEIIETLFRPGDRSILPRTPVSTRAGKSPWKAPSTAGFDMMSVRENVVFAFSEASGWTPYMEDRIIVSCPVLGRPAWSFFGVCDGHGGSFCSEFLASNIPMMLENEASILARYMGSSYLPGGTSNDSDTTPLILKEMLTRICADAEKKLKEHPRMTVERNGLKCSAIDSSGSTAVLALITSQYVVVANVGDSRAVLAQKAAVTTDQMNSRKSDALNSPFPYSTGTPRSDENGNVVGGAISNSSGGSGTGSGSNSSRCVLDAIPLSRDHKASIEEERRRIEASGANVVKLSPDRDVYEVYNEGSEERLRMSRSFGDFCLKQNLALPVEQQAIIAVPEVDVHVRHNRDAFLVIACDGVWDVMSNQEAVDYIGDQLGYTAYGGPVGGVSTARAAHACDALLQLCLEKGTLDNVSVVLVVLGPPPNHLPYSVSSSGSAYSKAQVSLHPSNTFDHHHLHHNSQHKRVLVTPPGIATATTTTVGALNSNNQNISSSSTTRSTSSINYNIEDANIAVEIPIFNHSEMNTGSLNEVFPSSSSSASCIYHSGNDEDDDDEEEEEEDISDDVIDIERSDLVVIDGDNIDEQILPEYASPLHMKASSSNKIRKHLTFND